jgi:hypothetical protein
VLPACLYFESCTKIPIWKQLSINIRR